MSIATNIVPRKEQGLSTHVAQGMALSIVLTVGSFIVGMAFGWIDAINWLEAFAVFTSYFTTFLCVVERRLNYITGMITTAAYSLLFFQWGLPASALVNAYLAFALLYGWFRWRSDTNTRPVTRVELKWVPVYILVTAIAYGGAVLLSNALGSQMAMTDSVILIGTILAQFLLDNKKIETWAIWAIVNVFAIYTYFTAGLALAGFQYIFFLLNTVYGAYMWKVSKRVTETEEAVTVAPQRELAVA